MPSQVSFPSGWLVEKNGGPKNVLEQSTGKWWYMVILVNICKWFWNQPILLFSEAHHSLRTIFRFGAIDLGIKEKKLFAWSERMLHDLSCMIWWQIRLDEWTLFSAEGCILVFLVFSCIYIYMIHAIFSLLFSFMIESQKMRVYRSWLTLMRVTVWLDCKARRKR